MDDRILNRWILVLSVVMIGLVCGFAYMFSVQAQGIERDVPRRMQTTLQANANGVWTKSTGGFESPNIASVSQTSTYIQVNYTLPLYTIAFAKAFEDGHLLAGGYQCSANAESLSNARISCTRSGVVVNPNTMTSSAYQIAFKAEGTYRY